MPIVRLLLVFLLVGGFGREARAHPFGARFLGHLVRLSVHEDHAVVAYRLELPTQTVVREMALHERTHGPDAVARYVPSKLDELESGLVVLVDGVVVPTQRLELPETGLGNAQFFLFDLAIGFDVPRGPHTIEITNGNHPDAEAWFAGEVLVVDTRDVTACTLDDLHRGDIRTEQGVTWVFGDKGRTIAVSVDEASGLLGVLRSVAGTPGVLRPAVEAAEPDPLVSIVQGEATPLWIAFALAASVFFGAAHALSPGHGKTLVAGYLVGSRGTIGQAVLLGLVVTFSHTISVFVLGLVTLQLTDTFAPEAIFPWLELLSGVLVLGVGLGLVRSRARGLRRRPAPHAAAIAGLSVGPPGPSEPLPLRGRTLPTAAGGPDGGWRHAMAHLLEVDHDHGLGRATDLRSLVSLGISGGIVPCPTALVVLLTAVSLHRVALGIVMVAAFSLGLGAVLIAIAVAVVKLGDRLRSSASGAWTRVLPVLSAGLVVVIGLGILVRSLGALI